MHETALIEGVMKIVDDQLRKNQLQRLNYIKLMVGEFSGAVPDALRFAFTATVAGTPHQDAVMEIQEIPGEAECRSCKAVFTYDVGMKCPQCGEIAPRLIKGEELYIDYIEAE